MKLFSLAVLSWLIVGPAAAAPELPSALKASGTLRVAASNRIPPLGFHDPATGRLTGFEVDLVDALAAKLGLRVAWAEMAGFPVMLLALQTGRVDAAVGAIADLSSRRTTVSFVDTMRSGAQIIVQTSRVGEFDRLEALCGHTVGGSGLTYFPDEVKAWSAGHCGGDPVRIVGTEGGADARSQLEQNRIDAAVLGSETVSYLMAQAPGAFAPVGPPLGLRYNGIAIARDDLGLSAALASALDALIAEGAYAALLARWHLEGSAVARAGVNAGP